MAAMTIFERLDRGRPPVETAIKPSKEPAQLLLDWLQTWDRPTIGAREIRTYGPRSSRSRESATSSIETLVKRGWLIPLKTQQRNWHKWRIVRRPIVYPTAAEQPTN